MARRRARCVHARLGDVLGDFAYLRRVLGLRIVIAASCCALLGCASILGIDAGNERLDADGGGGAGGAAGGSGGDPSSGGAGGVAGRGGTTAADPYAEAVMLDDPILYLRFEEADGDSTLFDEVSGATGTVQDGVGRVPGLFEGSQAIEIPIDNSAGDGVHAWFGAAPSFYVGITAFTIELWLEPVALGGVRGILNMRDHTADVGFRYTFGADGTLTFEPEDGMGAGDFINSGTPILDDQTAHVALTWDDGSVTYFIDGMQIGNSQMTTVEMGDAFMPLVIGSNGGVTSSLQPFGGIIDDLAIYGEALTQAQIQAHFDAAGTR